MSAVDKADIQALLTDFSLEITPSALGQRDELCRWLPPTTQIFVTCLPGTPVSTTLDACRVLEDAGFRTVPHVSARGLRSVEEWRTVLATVRELSGEVLLIAGGNPEPLGPFRDCYDLLHSGLIEALPPRRLWFAGHVEGHPQVAGADLRAAEDYKWAWSRNQNLSAALLTQFCFSADPVLAWAEALEQRQRDFPLAIGVAGLASIAALIKHARHCGVGPSLQYLLNSGWPLFNALLRQKPDKLLFALARARRTGRLRQLRQLHFYPFGGYRETLRWLGKIEAGQFELRDDGFRVR
mgnify:FL=1